MNTELLKSKKFRAALLAAFTALLTYGVSKYGWGVDVTELTLLITALSVPFLIYIGAEGYSEVEAKRAVEENKIRNDLTDKILKDVIDKGE
jgi:hypothetical protein